MLLRKKLKMALICTTVFVSSFYSSSVFAEYLGGQWGISKVGWKKLSEVPTMYDTPLKTGASNWNGIDSNISYVNESSGFEVRVINSPDEDYWAPRGYYGFGIPFGNDEYISGTLEIVRTNSDPLSSSDKARMLTHEFGHLLGLAHTEQWFTSSIMDESDVFDLDGPTDYDKTNIKNLYEMREVRNKWAKTNLCQ